MKNRTSGTLTLHDDGTSAYSWQRTDANGNVLVDFEAGTSAVAAEGTWFEDQDGVFVSDDSGVRHFIRLDDETLYEQNPSWLYSRE